MRPRSAVLLWDASRALGHVGTFVADKSHDDYLEDILLRSAVERQLEIVGEALSALRRTDPATAALIPELHAAVGFRNVLSHEYSAVDDDVVWRTATEQAPALKTLIEHLLPPVG